MEQSTSAQSNAQLTSAASTPTIAMVGFGDLAARVARRLVPAGWRCIGLKRNVQSIPEGVEAVAADLAKPATLEVLEALAPDALLITLTPSERSAEGYERGFLQAMEHIVAGLGEHCPRWVFFVSSTRVYGEANGGWVDESSPLATQDPAARAIIGAEAVLHRALPHAAVLRAGGLYGHGPGPLLKAVKAGRLRPATPLQYGNRVHREDVAAFIAGYVLAGADTAPLTAVVNLVDDAPVALQEVEAWLCEVLHLPYHPPAVQSDAPQRGHKRIGNTRLHDTGFRLTYPDYRAGYQDLLERA